MKIRLVESRRDDSNDNVLIGEALRHWLRRMGADCEDGCIIVALGRSGFSLLQLGPAPIDAVDLRTNLIWIGGELAADNFSVVD